MRKALPATIPLDDAVANLGAVALGVAGLAAGRTDLLRSLTVDRLHEPYRAEVYPQLPRLVEAAREAGALGRLPVRVPVRRSSPSPTRWPTSPASRRRSSPSPPTPTCPAGSPSSSRGPAAPPSSPVPVDAQRTLAAMGGLIDSVGNGISSLISGAFDAIGAALRGIVNAGNQALPGGLLIVVVFVALIGGAWSLAKR